MAVVTRNGTRCSRGEPSQAIEPNRGQQPEKAFANAVYEIKPLEDLAIRFRFSPDIKTVLSPPEGPRLTLADIANYAELAGLICPQLFIMHRRHRDGVAPDEWVAYEYARVRRPYVDLE